MEHIRILLLLPLLAIATASEADTQTDHAAQIETLLQSFYPPDTAPEIMQAPQHVIALSHCRLSMIQMTRARRELLFSGASYQADLTTTSLQPTADGALFDYIESPNPFAILSFVTDTKANGSVYRDLTAVPTQATIWEQNPSETGETTAWVFSVHSNPTQADMAELVDALMSYQQDFCTPAS